MQDDDVSVVDGAENASSATPEAPPLVTRVRLDLAYDGAHFSGWAHQRGQRTVQGVLTDALATILRCPLALTVAGRTDAGVHATGQVAHCDVPVSTWGAFEGSIVRRLAGVLPADVRVYGVRVAHPDFHARFAALRRHYCYRVTDQAGGGNPLRRGDTLWWPRQLDLSRMADAAERLCGEHDFAAFCRRREGATTIRRLERLSWERCTDGGAPVYEAAVTADAFCHSMVRSLIGALLAVGEGRKDSSWPASLLTRSVRASDVGVAPAHGLTLSQVDYPPDGELAARTEVTRRVRAPIAA